MLSEDSSELKGRARIELTNVAPVPMPDLSFHLYWNGWKNTRSTWLREQSHGAGRGGRKVRQDSFGAIDVSAIRLVARGAGAAPWPALESARDLLPLARFVAPDDGNADDETVMLVPLPEPIAPGAGVAVEVEFTLTVPRVIARTGRKDDFVFFAHWYPQLGVFDRTAGAAVPRGTEAFAWNTHQFHASTEFYGEYGSYDVTLTLPLKYDGNVGATGRRLEGPTLVGEKQVRYRFAAEDVHNFAWTADPRFVVERRRFVAADAEADPEYAAERERVRQATGLSDADLRLGDVEVTILLQPEHADQFERHFRAASEGLRWLGLWCGRYPYDTLTVVDPRHGSGSGGMEYPTLITAGTRISSSPREFTPEGVTVHEFAHQFFYGLVGTNEFEHAWMDEGLTTYVTARILGRAWGADWTQTGFGPFSVDGRPLVPFPTPATGLEQLFSIHGVAPPSLARTEGWPVLPSDPILQWLRDLPQLTYVPERRPPVETLRAGYLGRDPRGDVLLRPSFTYVDSNAYRTNSYQKPATILHTLERCIGEPAWTRVLRAYSARHRFRHPRPEDFFETVIEFAGEDLSGAPLRDLLRQTFGGSSTLDFAVSSATTRRASAPAGWFGAGADRRFVASQEEEPRSAEPADADHESEIVVRRLGEIAWPVEVEWKRKGEEPQRAWFDGRDRWWRRRFENGPALEWVRVDPDFRLLLDSNRTNNEYRIEADARPALRWTLRALLGAQTQLAFFGGLR